MDFFELLISFGRDKDWLTIFGLLFLLKIVYTALKHIWYMRVYTWSNPQCDFKAFADDGYALITGAGGGIGRAMAKQFAKRNIKLYLIDFNQELLTETVSDIRKNYPSLDVIEKVMDLRRLTG